MKDIPLKNYELIQTNDGSFTVYSKLFDESCHSSQGAKSETIKHYIEGCQILNNISNHSPYNILEVGLGFGVGLLETLKLTKDHPAHFITLEIDEDLVKYLIANLNELKNAEKIIDTKEYKLYTAQYGQSRISIIVGDARVTLKKFLNENSIFFHAIYQDAFSPKKNAFLWTKEWFELLIKNSHPDAIISTYSSSSSIRKSMLAAGWKLHQGEKFGHKRSSTRATVLGNSDPDILLHLEKSPVILLTDDNANSYTIEATHAKK